MFDRIVSFGSLMLVVASVTFFLAGSWLVMSGKMGDGDGVLVLSGWLVTAIVFAYRHADPAWLEPLSIVKSR
ncbi:MAG TPA: hypothetical protein VLY04_00495 [Bryobacteraceae bacterium]|nr:hypothetical protein [Bryobacteraceae bacterium]